MTPVLVVFCLKKFILFAFAFWTVYPFALLCSLNSSCFFSFWPTYQYRGPPCQDLVFLVLLWCERSGASLASKRKKNHKGEYQSSRFSWWIMLDSNLLANMLEHDHQLFRQVSVFSLLDCSAVIVMTCFSLPWSSYLEDAPFFARLAV